MARQAHPESYDAVAAVGVTDYPELAGPERAGELACDVCVAGGAERFGIFARPPQPGFPGGTLLRRPGMVAGMLYDALRDRL